MTDRQGIEIDYGPTCRGAWLDRGAMDRLIKRLVQLVTGCPVSAVQTLDPLRGHGSRKRFKDSDFGREYYNNDLPGRYSSADPSGGIISLDPEGAGRPLHPENHLP